MRLNQPEKRKISELAGNGAPNSVPATSNGHASIHYSGNGHAPGANGRWADPVGTNGHASGEYAPPTRYVDPATNAAGAPNDFDLKELLNIVRQYREWGITVALLVLAGAVVWANFFWQRQATADSRIVKVERNRSQLDILLGTGETTRNLESAVATLTSEANAQVIRKLIRLIGSMQAEERSEIHAAESAPPSLGTNPTDEDESGRPSYAGWLVIDYDTGERLDVQTALAFERDVLLIPPDQAQLLIRAFWNPNVPPESRTAILGLGETNSSRALIGMLNVSTATESSSISVGCSHPDSHVAVFMANVGPVAFMSLMARNSQVRSRQEVIIAREHLRAAERELSQAERDKETAIERVFRENNLDLDRGGVIRGNLEELTPQIAELNYRIDGLKLEHDAVVQQLATLETQRQRLAEETFVDPLDEQIRVLQDERRKIALLAPTVGSPDLRRLDEQIEKLVNQRKDRATRRHLLRERLVAMQARLAVLPENSAEFERIRIEVATLKGDHEALMAELLPGADKTDARLSLETRIIEVEARRAIIEGTINIELRRLQNLQVVKGQLPSIQPVLTNHSARVQGLQAQVTAAAASLQSAQVAAAKVPHLYDWQQTATRENLRFSSPTHIYFAGGLLALIAAFVAIYLADRLDNRVNTAAELYEITQLPLLGRVPTMNSNQRTMQPDAANPYGYQSIHSAISFVAYNLRQICQRQPGRGHIVQITSAISGEGKSTISSHLAMFSVKQGIKTCLLIGDRHVPARHVRQILKHPENPQGYIPACTPFGDGPRPDYAECVLETTIKNLYVALPGDSEIDSAVLFEGERFREFLNYLASRFDFVFIDSPPVMPIVDAMAIGRCADTTILVARAGSVRQAEVRATMEQLSFVNIPVRGAILNFSSRIDGYYRYRYNYYYYSARKTPGNEPLPLIEAPADSATTTPTGAAT